MAKDAVFAALDLGSNSFHLLVAEAGDGHWQVLDKLKHTVRLAQGLQGDGTLDETVKRRALQSLEHMAQRLRGVPADNTRVVGTKALRAASADRDFLQRAEAILGVPIEVISGREEARLIYHGVCHSLPPLKKNRLVMDIGGGSTELITGHQQRILQRESLDMGCVTFTRRYFDSAGTDKPFAHSWAAAVLEARRVLRPYRRHFLDAGWQQAVGASGTFRATAAVLVANGWTDGGIDRAGLNKLGDWLMANGPQAVSSLAGLNARRAPVFIGGLAIVKGLFESLGLERMEVARGALREGVILDLSGRAANRDVRGSSVTSLARRFSVDAAQVGRVQSVIDALLDAADTRLLKKKQRQLLYWAVELHEAGLSIAHSGHHRHGAYVVENADMPGFSQREQAQLAFLIRHQRGKPEANGPVGAESDKRQLAVQLPLLRAAVAVCRSRLESEQEFANALRGVRWQATDNGPGTLELTLDTQWLQRNPLIAADLRKAARQLRAWPELVQLRLLGTDQALKQA